MKVVLKNSKLSIKNFNVFRLKQNIKTLSKNNERSKLFVRQCKNYLLLFKNYYCDNITFYGQVINKVNSYILLNNISNYYLITKNANFECAYNLTYKTISSRTIKRCIKIFLTSKPAVYINSITCLTKKFVNKT
jgi:hypothetical protein